MFKTTRSQTAVTLMLAHHFEESF